MFFLEFILYSNTNVAPSPFYKYHPLSYVHPHHGPYPDEWAYTFLSIRDHFTSSNGYIRVKEKLHRYLSKQQWIFSEYTRPAKDQCDSDFDVHGILDIWA